MNHRALVQLGRISTFLPLLGTIILLVAGTFYSDLFNAVPLPLLLATMAVSFVLTAVHLESHLHTNTEVVRNLGERIEALERQEAEYLRGTVPTLQNVSLGQGFEIARARGSRIGHLRVFAISSQQILGFLRFHPFEVETCSLLVRGFEKSDEAHREFRSQIELVVRDWRALQRDGRIRSLTVRSYDFFPTEYECIFDDKLMLLGLYSSDPEDYSEVRVRRAALIENSNPAGGDVITEYSERFDELFELCKTYHGPDAYNDPPDPGQSEQGDV